MLDPKKVSGYKSLEKSKGATEIFEAFLENFYNAQGTEARETIEPLKVKIASENGKPYIRFEYEMYGRKEWLHVTSPRTWY